MNIAEISGMTARLPGGPKQAETNPGADGKSFGDFLGEVNEMINDAGKSVKNVATGEVEDIHEVMVAVEKAGIGLELVLEIRNKLLESYREVMRMQM